MVYNKLNLLYKRFGKLVVVSEAEKRHQKTRWLCECDCGNSVEVYGSDLISGKTISCQCNKIKHGHSSNRKPSTTYSSWQAMIARCNNKKHIHYKYYGGRGVTICARWLTFENFLLDMGERPVGKTLDRYPANKMEYNKENCRWATKTQQSTNQRRYLK